MNRYLLLDIQKMELFGLMGDLVAEKLWLL